MVSMYRLLLSLTVCLCLTYDANGFTKSQDWLVNCQQSQCEAIIDAGSSGTRLHVYQRGVNQGEVIEVLQQKIEPGLSQLKLTQIHAYLQKLFPVDSGVTIKTYFYATAGMRLLSAKTQDAYYQKINAWFKQQDVWQLAEIRTITGQEEGAFAWLAVNHGKDIHDMLAVIEFGGASAQVIIPIPDDKKALIADNHLMHLKMNGQAIHLWSKSYLGLGINEVEKRVATQSSCYSTGYPLKNGQLADGDAGRCIQGIENNRVLSLIRLLNETKQLLVKLHQPMVWTALGAFYYTANTPPLTFAEHQLSLNALKRQADNVSCHQDWLSLMTAYQGEAFLYRNCLAASYFYAFMADGMGVDVDGVINLPQQHQEMDWAYGVILAHQN